MNPGQFAGVSGPLTQGSDIISVRVANQSTQVLWEDRGGCVRKTASGAVTYSVTPDAIGGWNRSVAVVLANDSTSGDITVSPDTGVTLVAGTTTGPFVLVPGESRLLHRVAPNSWRIR